MKKLLFFVLAFCAVLTTFAQRTENYTNRVIQPTYVRSLIRIGTSTYDYTESTSVSEIKIGLSTPNLYGCGFVVYDLASILGTNPNATSATLRVKLYNSAGQPPSLIYGIITLDNGIINSSASQQWQTIAQGSSTTSANYNQVLEYNVTSLINSNSTSGKITIGFRSENIGQMYDAIQYATITFTGTATVQEQISVSVKNNFNGGKIKAKVDTPPTSISNSPVTITNMTSKTLYIEAVEGSSQPDFEYYARVFNDTEGSNNKSNWRKEDQLGVPQGNFSSSVSTSVTLSSSEKNYSYVADMKKLCNATFVSSGGTVYVDGNSYSSPRISPVVEQNSVYAFATNYTANGLDYIFAYWDNSPSSNTITVTAHGTYTAAFTSKPSIVYRNQQVTSSIGQQITLTWNANPNPNLTAYRVYRKIGHSGTGSLIGSTSNTTFTDPDYIMTGSSEDTYLMYDVRPYIFQTESDPYFESAVFGRGGLESMLENNLIVTSALDVPTVYSITNYPNPFNPTTTINYQLPENGFVTIKVYDMLGKEIATLVNGNRTAGYHKVTFDAGRLTSGIYIYTINAGKYTLSKKMLLMK
ncbi:hypothetical protein C0389_09075 [bacterium]|nr:hypothetical protein [bacterium]